MKMEVGVPIFPCGMTEGGLSSGRLQMSLHGIPPGEDMTLAR